MAKKKDEGSNLGLIITLVFFVLATVILGVTTYMGYSEQEKFVKEKDEAVKAKGVADNDKNWYRFQARYYRAIMGVPVSDKDAAADLAREKDQFDKGQLNYATGQKDKDDVEKTSKDFSQKGMTWDASKRQEPDSSYEERIKGLNLQVQGLLGELKKARDGMGRAVREKEDAETAASKEIAALTKSVKDLQSKAAADRQADLGVIASQGVQVDRESKAVAGLRKQLDDATKDLAKQTRRADNLEKTVQTASREQREAKEALEDMRVRLAALYEKTGQNPVAVEQAVLDKQATTIIKDWKRDWRIVEVDRSGRLPYISLGSADGLVPQVTFSVHAVGLDGKLNPLPKGTVEVVRNVGSHLAQVRVTSVKDPKNDPIVRGDRIFNATWDPNRKKRVAIAGLADLGGEGTDNSDDFRRMLTRQNVVIDAYIDTKDDKAPRIVGPGVSVNTDYLIMADTLEGLNHPKARDKEYTTRFEKLMREMRDKAASTGVTVIPLRKYLDLIGYQAPKILSTNPLYFR